VKRPLGLVYNPAAGDGRWRPSLDGVCRALETAGGDVEMFATRAAGDGVEQARLAASRYDLVAIHGGDGSINEAFNGIIASGRSPRVLLLPGGTMNVLCRDLGIPLDSVEAAELLKNGVPRRLCLGLSSRNGDTSKRYFALMAGAGLDAAIVHGMQQFAGAKRVLGPFAFLLSGLWRGVPYRYPEIEVVVEEGEAPGTYRGREVVVGKSKGYGGWFTVTDRADSAQPVFEVAIAKRKGMLRHLAAMPLAFFGQLKLSRNYIFTMSTRLRITSTGPVPVQMDGDATGMLPIELFVDGAAVEVLVPPT
jgi:diacylglycerol kinase (ATP)